MNLDEYLQGLENYTSEKDLLSKLVFYDNWDILLRADFNKVVSDLETSGNYQRVYEGREDTKEGDKVYFFNYVPGTVLLQVYSISFEPSPRLSKEQQEKQKKYEITISLHPVQATRHFPEGKKFEGKTDIEAMAMAIRDLGNYAKVKGVALCFVRPNIYFEPSQKSETNSKLYI